MSLETYKCNILFVRSECREYYLVKPKSFLLSPYKECYREENFSYEKFLIVFAESKNCEFSSKHNSIIVKDFWLKKFIQQMREHNLTCSFSNEFFDKPIDYYCSTHYKEDFFLLISFNYNDSYVVIPVLDHDHMVNFDHLFKKTKCYKHSNGKELFKP